MAQNRAKKSILGRFRVLFLVCLSLFMEACACLEFLIFDFFSYSFCFCLGDG